MNDLDAARRRSAALFNNEKLVEVVLALDEAGGATHAQELSRSTAISHSLVRAALQRLVAAEVLATLPKTGGTRSAQYYERIDGELWSSLVTLARIAGVRARESR